MGQAKNQPQVHLDSVPSSKVIADLHSGDRAKEENVIYRSQIQDYKAKEAKSGLEVKNLEGQVDFLKLSGVEKDSAFVKQEKIADNNFRMYKREKNKSTLWKFAVPAAAVIGFILGRQ